MIVILPGGQLAKPILVEKLNNGLLTLTVDAAVNEEVTVTTGVAPSIEASPGAALTVLSSREIALRAPANLMGAVEIVPGVNQVSEGQAAVPAIRGLARGRTLILIDGSRVTSERRVGPSATFMDPAVVEGIDIARGPGSVAYGSDAFGGIISVRTKRPPRAGTQFSWIADARRRRAGAARRRHDQQGFQPGRRAVFAARPQRGRLRRPGRRGPELGLGRQRVPAPW